MPDPKSKQNDTVTVDRAEFEAMLQQNMDNASLIEQMAAKLDRLESAQLAGVGIDPAIAARALLPRKMVQFTKHYTRASVPSTVQDGALVHEGYAVFEGDIVNLREDEVKRLQKDRPGLLVTDQSKWLPKVSTRYVPGRDEHGRFAFKPVRTELDVKKLIEIAPDVG